MTLLLASGSATRAALLAAAGVEFEIAVPHVDEAAVKAALLAEGRTPRDIADALAETKALKVSRRHPGALVLGADQVLVADGVLHDKPGDMAAARAQLLALRGRTHSLFSAACLCEGGAPVWRHVSEARLTMRRFSDAFLDTYLGQEGESLLHAVGGYRLEGRGAQLFDRVEGDHFTVLGLPLLETLAFLRIRGVCLA